MILKINSTRGHTGSLLVQTKNIVNYNKKIQRVNILNKKVIKKIGKIVNKQLSQYLFTIYLPKLFNFIKFTKKITLVSVFGARGCHTIATVLARPRQLRAAGADIWW